MLRGAFPMSVDAKARVTLPASFRKQMGKTIVLVPYGGHVNGFTPEGFEHWLDLIFDRDEKGFDPRSKRDEDLQRAIFGRLAEADVDSAGRIALGKLDVPRPGTRERLGLVGDVMVVGMQDRFEVWNAERWNEAQDAFDDEFESLLYRD